MTRDQALALIEQHGRFIEPETADCSVCRITGDIGSMAVCDGCDSSAHRSGWKP